ncbi:hypothetical protein JW859_07935 [bacterium]|nr:hypothetical protein [bacterium]
MAIEVERIRQDIFARMNAAINALLEMALKDALSSDGSELKPGKIVVEDAKEEIKSGTVQDAEFGIAIVSGRNLLLRHNQLQRFRDYDAQKEQQIVNDVLFVLTKRVLRNLFNAPYQLYSEPENQALFFVGDPYAYYREKGKSAKTGQNIDAAMLTISFLSYACVEIDAILNSYPKQHFIDDDKDIKDVLAGKLEGIECENLHELCLFVIDYGLTYAKQCMVRSGGGDGSFVGFAPDPDTAKLCNEHSDVLVQIDREEISKQDTSIPKVVDKFDRLFYTYSVMETIEDLKRWSDSYLSEILSNTALGKEKSELVRSIQTQVEWLRLRASEAFIWTNDMLGQYLAGDGSGGLGSSFKDKYGLDLAEIVNQVHSLETEYLKEGVPQEKELNRKIDEEIAPHVQQVFYLSHLLAVRSMTIANLDVDDTLQLIKSTHKIMQEDVIASGLDNTLHGDLARSLQRKYSFGSSLDILLIDDACVGLVFRGIAGVILRIIQSAKHRESAGFKAFINEALEIVESEYDALVNRHPAVIHDFKPDRSALGSANLYAEISGSKWGMRSVETDRRLWSFMDGGPYVLYATQRTILAMLVLSDLLDEYEDYLGRGSVDVIQNRIKDTLTKSLAEALVAPLMSTVMDDLAKQVQNWAGSLVKPAAEAKPQAPVSALPTWIEEPAWLNEIVHGWLRGEVDEFVEELSGKQVKDLIKQKASILFNYRSAYLENTDDSSSKAALKKEYKARWSEILKDEIVGENLKRMHESEGLWTEENVREELLRNVLVSFLKPGEKLRLTQFITENKTALLEEIQSIDGIIRRKANQ